MRVIVLIHHIFINNLFHKFTSSFTHCVCFVHLIHHPLGNNYVTYTILQEEVEAAVKALKKGKAAGVDDIPAELV